jgi:two-component system nitrate/nitrite response regulator NarL
LVNQGGTPVTPLTEDEKQVLKLLAQERTGKEIAVELGSSDGTVQTAIRSILTKLEVHSRLEKAAAVKGAFIPIRRMTSRFP